jgi:cbb3-type cytochrome oxidase maturation protein
MEVLPLIITVSLALVAGIAAVFIWAVRSDQFEDLEGPAWRMLQDDDSRPPPREPDEADEAVGEQPGGPGERKDGGEGAEERPPGA